MPPEIPQPPQREEERWFVCHGILLNYREATQTRWVNTKDRTESKRGAAAGGVGVCITEKAESEAQGAFA